MIAIVDSGGANIASVVDAFERLGASVQLTRDPAAIRAAKKVVLPGVGAAAPAMARLREAGLEDCLKSLTQPVLGICLGLQLLFERSEEGNAPCLGLIPGMAALLRPEGLPVPHMGWNRVGQTRPSPLFRGIADGEFFYFTHSYQGADGAWVTARCDYGGPVTAAVERGNFLAVQFHPERSSKAGARLLENFLAL